MEAWKERFGGTISKYCPNIFPTPWYVLKGRGKNAATCWDCPKEMYKICKKNYDEEVEYYAYYDEVLLNGK